MGQSPIVEGTNDLNTFQVGARSIDPSRMTAEQWLTNRQMALISTAAVSRLGTGNVARYPLIDITNAVISRMLMGGPGPDGSDSGFKTQGAIFYEVRSVGQKSNGMLEQLFVRPTMAVLNAAADGSLYGHPGAGWEGSRSVKASPAAAARARSSDSTGTLKEGPHSWSFLQPAALPAQAHVEPLVPGRRARNVRTRWRGTGNAGQAAVFVCLLGGPRLPGLRPSRPARALPPRGGRRARPRVGGRVAAPARRA
jgi:hypothetical protein